MLCLFWNKIFSKKYHILWCLCVHHFLRCQIHWNPNWLQDVFFIYIFYLTLKALQHHYFIYFILKQILPLQMCFSYIFVVYYSPLQSYSVHVGSTQLILSTLVLFGPRQFTLVLFSPLYPLSSYSVNIFSDIKHLKLEKIFFF